MRTDRLGFWLKLGAAWILTIGAVLLLAEGLARLGVRDMDSELAHDVRNVLTRPGLPTFGQAFDFDPALFWVLKPNLKEWKVKGALDGFAVDFGFSTTPSRLRVMPPLPGPEEFRILVLGDSCAFGFGVEDGESWPARLQALLNAERATGCVQVIDAGVPGYTAYQGATYLKREGLSLHPSLVLAAFWANDQIRSTSITDEERAVQYAKLRYDGLLMHSRFYAAIRQQFRGPVPLWSGGKAERTRLDEQQYERALREIQELCAERGIRLAFINWPLKYQALGKMARHPYQELTSKVAASTGTPLIDLTQPFAASPEDTFIDAIHATPKGCEIAARTIAAEVGPMLKRGDSLR